MKKAARRTAFLDFRRRDRLFAAVISQAADIVATAVAPVLGAGILPVAAAIAFVTALFVIVVFVIVALTIFAAAFATLAAFTKLDIRFPAAAPSHAALEARA